MAESVAKRRCDRIVLWPPPLASLAGDFRPNATRPSGTRHMYRLNDGRSLTWLGRLGLRCFGGVSWG